MNKHTNVKNKNMEDIYTYLVDHFREAGYAPSVRDICSGVGIKSTSTVHKHLKALQEDGRINYTEGKRRAIQIVDSDAWMEETDVVRIPMIGTVTAGQPILTAENLERTIAISEDLVANPEESYVLRVRGDSMIDAGILSGDFVIVERKQAVNEGQIVVGLIDGEATVKRFGYLDGQPYLFPENEYFEPIPFNREDCEIIGQVVSVFRTKVN